MRNSIFWDSRRYGEFLAGVDGISTNILASRLKHLQEVGVLEKHPDPSDGKASLYFPTERGLRLVPVLLEAIRWGRAEFEDTEIPERMHAVLQNSPEAYMDDKREQLAEERAALHNV